MTWLEEPTEFAQHKLADAQSAILAVKGEQKLYRSRLGIRLPPCSDLELWLAVFVDI